MLVQSFVYKSPRGMRGGEYAERKRIGVVGGGARVNKSKG